MVNGRELSLDMLLEITSGREYSHIVMRNVLEKYNYIEHSEKAFIKRLTEGTLERMIQLDYCLNQFSKVPVNKMKPLIRNLLRMSAYQILFMDAVPDSAACNEAVKLAEKRKFHPLKGFVNGVLRNLARQKEQIEWPNRKKDEVGFLSVWYSMPEWIVKRWIHDYGAELTETVAAAVLTEHRLTVRLAEQLSDGEKEETLKELLQAGVTVQEHPCLPYAYVLSGTDGLGNLKPFTDGKLYAQDVSSMLVTEIAGMMPGQQVLDVCAAPGGKALHAAARLLSLEKQSGIAGHVEARDLTEAKVRLIEENRERLGIPNLSVRIWDATMEETQSRESADILFVDVPCSGLGILGKKRDIKYRVTPDSIEKLVPLQREILETVWQYVKKGGILIYSTCTIHKSENEENVKWFLDRFPFKAESLEDCLPQQLRTDTTADGYLQLLPGVHQTDGFFLAKFRRMEV